MEALLTSLEQALVSMVAARTAEGGRLEAVIADQLAAVERLVATVQNCPHPGGGAAEVEGPAAAAFRAGISLDEGRLYQEAALIATRADVEEELKRLTAHVAGARESKHVRMS